MEPNAGTNGIVAPDTFWPALREETRRRGVYLIADEVMSGFGRCGEWFAWQRYGEAGRPDLMTLAKGLTGAHIPLGAVVLSAEVAAKLEHQMLNTGLTYCGHPLSCAAGVAAIQAYEEEGLIRRSRTLGAWMFERLRAMQARHAVIGDVRGGHGLFAVLELVRDRATREPLRPWPEVHPALKSLVSPGPGRRRVVRDPRQPDSARAAAGDHGNGTGRRPGRAGSPHREIGLVMTFKLTYSTMFNPPEEMHERFEAALAEVRSRLGATHALYIDGRDVAAARTYAKHSPIDHRLLLGHFPLGDAADVEQAMSAARARFRWLAATPMKRSARAGPPGRRPHRGTRLCHWRRHLSRGREEPDGVARRDPGDRGFLPGLRG